MAIMTPTILLGTLNRTDGSATYTQGPTTIIACVNGPMEVRPRDELPQEAYIEVVVRPAIGVAGTKERYLESRLLSAIKPIIIRSNHPRTMIQIVLQVVEASNHGSSSLLLAPLLNAAVLALLDASAPCNTVLVATLLAVTGDGEVVVEPGVKDIKAAKSRHVLAFTSTGELGFVESEGVFDMEVFERAVDVGRGVCGAGEKDGMEIEGSGGVGELVRRVVAEKLRRELRWRE